MSEIPEQYLEQARDHKLEELIDEMKSGEGDNEALWNEINRMLCSKTKEDADAVEDMTLADIIEQVCADEANRLMDCGMLDEEAMECAQGAAESRYEGDR